ncbi:diaminopimelate decarboxylase [Nocardia sp. CDC159]|uniref:Diaminopimelate decarboxylase n=1 Tax=Nocardia pulmonis TaxID=2951408 RepID=A0A9X2EAG8_9NOCA|nr:MULTISPECIES: diaminopimelate decarboxylase [Nocardia]MCM6777137.1 diaminopimelate decarboxylase [Nocardia pulmonis]MCM6790022.1 diaminopimelate decarboxylase [Nocardia sp. CDC159]
MSEFSVQGLGISQLVGEFGTPLYVYDGAVIERTYAELRARLHEAIDIFYSLKPNPNVSIVRLLHRAGALAEVCSPGELASALRAGVAPADILYTGPGKSRVDLRHLVDLDIRAVICESFEELAELDELAAAAGRRPRVLVRVNPAFGVRGGRLTMAGKPREFGIDEEQVLAATDLVARHPHLRVIGIHCFTGTRILDAGVVVDNTRRILDLAIKVSEQLGIEPELVDIGGGIGIPYFPNERAVDLDALAAGVNAAVAEFLLRYPRVRIAVEPGRFLVGPAGTYAIAARSVKISRGQRFVITDGGTHQHMSAVGTGTYLKRNFPMALLSDPDREPAGPCTVTGLLLTPTDIIGKDVELPEIATGEVLGVFQSGAYGPSASITYMNGRGYPAEVLVHQGRAHLIRSRDTEDDLFTRQHLVNFDEDPLVAEVYAEIRRMAGGESGAEVGEISRDTLLFDDLALDSLSIVELLTRLEDRFGVVVDPHELDPGTVRTVGSITDFVLAYRRES